MTGLFGAGAVPRAGILAATEALWETGSAFARASVENATRPQDWPLEGGLALWLHHAAPQALLLGGQGRPEPRQLRFEPLPGASEALEGRVEPVELELRLGLGPSHLRVQLERVQHRMREGRGVLRELDS